MESNNDTCANGTEMESIGGEVTAVDSPLPFVHSCHDENSRGLLTMNTVETPCLVMPVWNEKQGDTVADDHVVNADDNADCVVVVNDVCEVQDTVQETEECDIEEIVNCDKEGENNETHAEITSQSADSERDIKTATAEDSCHGQAVNEKSCDDLSTTVDRNSYTTVYDDDDDDVEDSECQLVQFCAKKAESRTGNFDDGLVFEKKCLTRDELKEDANQTENHFNTIKNISGDDSDNEVQVLRDDTVDNFMNWSDCDVSEARCISKVDFSDKVDTEKPSISSVICNNSSQTLNEDSCSTKATETVFLDDASIESVDEHSDEKQRDFEVIDSTKDETKSESWMLDGEDIDVCEVHSGSSTTVNVQENYSDRVHVQDNDCITSDPKEVEALLISNGNDDVERLCDWKTLYEKTLKEKLDLQLKVAEQESLLKTSVDIEREKVALQTRTDASKERELSELRALLEKLNKNDETGECSVDALQIQLSKKNLEIGKLNDTIDEVEENLQIVFAEKNTFSQKIEELKDQLAKLEVAKGRMEAFASEQLKNKDAENAKLQEKLDASSSLVKSLEAALLTSQSNETKLAAELVDSKERIAMLEIDLEFTSDKFKDAHEQHSKQMSAVQSELQRICSELRHEQAVSQSLRHELKETMEFRLEEQRSALLTENENLRKELQDCGASVMDNLERLEHLKGEHYSLLKENRGLKADVKSLRLDNNAYRLAAEQLKKHVHAIENQANANDSINLPAPFHVLSDDGDSDSLEVITIDTDDQETDDDRQNVSIPMRALLSKRSHCPVGAESIVQKRPRLAVEDSPANEVESRNSSGFGSMVDAAANSDHVSQLTGNEECITVILDQQKDKAEKTRNVEEQPGKTMAENVELEATSRHDVVGLPAYCLQSEFHAVVKARDELQLQLSFLNEALVEEKKKVEYLEKKISSRASIEQATLLLQQGKLQEIKQDLLETKSVLSERESTIALLRDEVSKVSREKTEACSENLRLEANVSELTAKHQIYELETARLTEVSERLDAVSVCLTEVLNERTLLNERLQVLKDAEEHVTKLKEKNASLESQLNSALSERDRLQEMLFKLTNFEVSVDELQDIIEQLTKEADDLKSERIELVEELVKAQQKADEQQSAHSRKVSEMKETMSVLVKEKEKTASSVEELQLELQKCLTSSAEFQKDSERAKQLCETLRKELSDKEAHFELLKTEGFQLKVDLEESQSKVRQAEKEISTLKDKISMCESQLLEYRTNCEALTGNVTELSAEVKACHNLWLKANNLEKELASVLGDKRDLLKILSEIKRLAVNSKSVSPRHYALWNELNTLSSSMGQAIESLKSNEERVMIVKSDVPHLAKEEEQLMVRRNGLQINVETVLHKLNDDGKTYTEMENTVIKLQEENARLRCDIADLELRLKTTSSGTDLRPEEEISLPSTSRTSSSADLKRKTDAHVLETGSTVNSKTLDTSEQLDELRSEVQRLSDRKSSLHQSALDLQVQFSDEGIRKKYPGLGVKRLGADVKEVESRTAEFALNLQNLNETTDRNIKECRLLENDLKLLEFDGKPSGDCTESTVVKELTEKLNALEAVCLSLQNRLKLSLVNGRRMEAILESLQKSRGKDLPDSSEKLQKECDDLHKKLKQSEDSNRRLKVKLIDLKLSHAPKKGSLCNSVESLDLDKWEHVDANRADRECEVPASSSTEVLSELPDGNKVKEGSCRKRLLKNVQSTGSAKKKHSKVVDMDGNDDGNSIQLANENIQMRSSVTKKSPFRVTGKKGLITMTNGVSQLTGSQLKMQPETAHVLPPRSSALHPKSDNCEVQ